MGASPELDVAAIGNAIVDIVCRCDDAFLSRMGLKKGAMRIVESADELSRLASLFPRKLEVAGGSASNVAVGVASFGGRAAFIGRVLDDGFGRLFCHDLRAAGIDINVRIESDPNVHTARSLILITPDGQRTMLTYLGLRREMDPGMVETQRLKAAKYIFIEGYLFDSASALTTIRTAVASSAGAGRAVALALSDPDCVARNRLNFKQCIKSGVGLVIANEAEIASLYQTTSFDDAVALAAKDIKSAVLTRGAKGCVVLTNGQSIPVSAEKVSRVVDSTGAGDMFAAGLLFGLCRGMDLEKSAQLGAFAASEIISQVSARPEVRLIHSARLRGLVSV